jgi:hypothetical protein
METEELIERLRKNPRDYLRAIIIAAQQPCHEKEVAELRRILKFAADAAPLPDLISWARALQEIVDESTLQ